MLRNLCQMRTYDMLLIWKGQVSAYINIYIAPQNIIGTTEWNCEFPEMLLFFVSSESRYSNSKQILH